MKLTGVFFSLAGIVGLIYGFFMETTVGISNNEFLGSNLTAVHNIGLLNMQQNIVIASSSFLIVGILIYLSSVFITEQGAYFHILSSHIIEIKKNLETSSR